jgi:DNA sulfur modification protein DndD
MILQQLTVRNFGVFAGDQVFDLTPARRQGKHLPIVLFGGVNGGGKTTLLDALQLALYGPRARCSKRTASGYDDFLRASVHHGADAAGVALAFRYAADGTDRLYDLDRRWRLADGRVREELRVFVDGLPDPWLADNWPQMVEEFFPLEIAQLFFFDAEKIRTLAEDESSSKALGAAIKALLGLDLVERLIADSAVVQTRLAKKAGPPEQQAELAAREEQFRETRRRLEAVKAEQAALENRLLRAKADAEEAKQAFAPGGGKVWEGRQEILARQAGLEQHRKELVQQLAGLAAGALPLALVADLLEGVRQQHQRERAAAEAEVVRRLLEERDDALLGLLGTARAPAGLVRRVADHLARDRRARQPAADVPPYLHLSAEAAGLVGHLCGSELAQLRAAAGGLLERLASAERERADLEESLAAAPAEAEIRVLSDRFQTATHEFARLEEQAAQLKVAVEAQQAVVQEAGKGLTKVVQGQLEAEFTQENLRRMLELAGRTRETMQVFLGRVTERKIDRLGKRGQAPFLFPHFVLTAGGGGGTVPDYATRRTSLCRRGLLPRAQPRERSPPGLLQGRRLRRLPQGHRARLRRGAAAGAGLLPAAQPLPPGGPARGRRRPEPLDALAAEHPRAPLSPALPLRRPPLAGPLPGLPNRAG